MRRELEFAVDTARAAGRITLRYFQTGVDVDTKADHSPVTIAAREAELEIRTRLQRAFPEIIDFYLPPEACSYRMAVVRIRKAYAGHAKRIMMGAWS